MDENILSRSPIYSYSLCAMECRARKTLEICGCIPHYYRVLRKMKLLQINLTYDKQNFR